MDFYYCQIANQKCGDNLRGSTCTIPSYDQIARTEWNLNVNEYLAIDRATPKPFESFQIHRRPHPVKASRDPDSAAGRGGYWWCCSGLDLWLWLTSWYLEPLLSHSWPRLSLARAATYFVRLWHSYIPIGTTQYFPIVFNAKDTSGTWVISQLHKQKCISN